MFSIKNIFCTLEIYNSWLEIKNWTYSSIWGQKIKPKKLDMGSDIFQFSTQKPKKNDINDLYIPPRV